MKYYLFNFLVAIFLGVLIGGCADLQTNIPAEKKVSVHKEGFANKTSVNFHGKYIAENNYDMRSCRQCHAGDYSGGLTGVSCLTCHTSPGGPEACNTCHGDFTDPSKIAPPRALDGETSSSAITVGAHSDHLYSTKLGNATPCNECHKVPSKVYDDGHFNPDKLVSFSDYAISHGAANAAFDASTGTCSNTYCHGNFSYSKASAPSEDQFAFTDTAIVGNITNTVVWDKNLDGSQIKCGSCHALPPKGHIGYQDPRYDITTCSACHQGVIDAQGNIIDVSKHINGKANVRGN